MNFTKKNLKIKYGEVISISIDFILFLALIEIFGVEVLFASFISFLISLIHRYIIDTRFLSLDKLSWKSLDYIAISFIELIISQIFIYVCINFLLIHYIIAKVITMIFVIVLNFILKFLLIEKKVIKFSIVYNLNKIINIIFCCIFGYIIFVVLIFDKRIMYACQNALKIENSLIIILLLFLFCIFIYFYLKYSNFIQIFIKEKLRKLNIYYVLATIFIVFFIIQLIIIKSIYFKPGWDADTVTTLAYNSVDNISLIGKNEYLQTYPNNFFITIVFTIIIKLFNLIGLGQYSGYALSTVGGLLVNLSCLIAALCVYESLHKKAITIITYLLGGVFLGLSPWIVVPYTDTYSIIFPITLLYLYIIRYKVEHTWIIWGIIIIVSIIGYYVKPTVIITLLAILINSLIILASSMKKFGVKSLIRNNNLKICSSIVISAIVSLFVFSTISNCYNFDSKSEKSFSMWHFMMMGLNEETLGVYNYFDVDASKACSTRLSRIEMNKSVITDRLLTRTPYEHIKFFTKKLLTICNDGTFAWSQEGGFYLQINENNSSTSLFLKNYFYPWGGNYLIYNLFMQFLWIIVLFGTFMCGFFENKSKYLVGKMCIMGITLFCLLFEARSRYLFLYGPIYIYIALLGYNNLKIKVSESYTKLKS